MRNSFVWITVPLLCLIAKAEITKEYSLLDFNSYSVSQCSAYGTDRYFGSSVHACKTCSSGGLIPDVNSLDGAGNPTECECPVGFMSVIDDCSLTPVDATGTCVGRTCTSCITATQTSYSDRSACVSCDPITTLGVGTDNDCTCPAGQVLQEVDYFGVKLPQKICSDCPSNMKVITADTIIAGFAYKSNAYKCQACPDPLMTMTQSLAGVYSCSCPSGYTMVGVAAVGNQSCALTTTGLTTFNSLVPQAVRITYHDAAGVGTINSLTLQHYFTLAATRCTYYGGPEDVKYCQILANLCALQLFDVTTEVCKAHMNIVALRGLNLQQNVENWATGQPWLYYGGGAVACKTDIYGARVTLKDDHLRYAVAAYTLNGTFRGYSTIESLFSYCGVDAPNTAFGGGDSGSTKWQIFAFTQNITYQCELSRLLSKEQLFYELYLYHPNKYPIKYAPVPVRVLNLRANGENVNLKYPKYLCDDDDVLVRRFFLHDIVSGISSVSSSAASLLVMRYASYIKLETSTGKKSATILPPVLTIEYTEVTPAQFNTQEGTVEFEANYIMDTEEFFSTMQAFFIAYMVLTSLYFVLRYYNWTVRNARVVTTAVLSTDIGGLNLSNVFEFCMLAMSTWVMTFFWFQLLICWYFFVFFKIQTVPSVMLPPQNNIYSPQSPYFLFVCNLHVMTIFQLAYVMVIIYRQCSADLFFIDWEPAKTSSTDVKNKAGAVSVWRTIMVANEWSEMQSLRKTDIRFTLFALGLFLIGLRLQYNATPQPNLDDKSAGELNIILRFANTTFFWMIFSLGQYLWKFLIFERYFSEPPERLFVDFCTIAKVSVIILDEKYHGYYLHCRSPHQFADGTMVELVEMLHKEEAGLTVDRSLDGAPADVQSFQIFLTGEWRASFDKIYSSLMRPITMTEILQQGRNKGGLQRGVAAAQGSMQRNMGGGFGLQLGVNTVPPERVMKAWRELTVFLQEFVENNFGKAGLRRVVREPTYYDKLASAGPDLSIVDQPSVFLTDREYKYCKVLFLGREAELLLLNILSYSLFDLWFNNTAISMALCYLLDFALCTVRQWWGQVISCGGDGVVWNVSFGVLLYAESCCG